jgi:hypothetical protein
LANWHDGLPVIQMAVTGLALMSFCSSCCNAAVISTHWGAWLRRRSRQRAAKPIPQQPAAYQQLQYALRIAHQMTW